MRFIKKIDIFVFKAFSLLFVGTFFICLFIFMMQFMWRYVDELIGKAENMVRYMMDKRGVEIKDLIIEYSTTKDKDIASAIVSVVYLNEDIMEG